MASEKTVPLSATNTQPLADPSAAAPPHTSSGSTGRRHGPRHPAGAEEDWDLSSDDERAAAAAAVVSGRAATARRRRGGARGGSWGEGAAGAHARGRSLAEVEGFPTFAQDLPALMDLVRARVGGCVWLGGWQFV